MVNWLRLFMLFFVLVYFFDAQLDGKLGLPRISTTGQFETLSDLVSKLANWLKRRGVTSREVEQT